MACNEAGDRCFLELHVYGLSQHANSTKPPTISGHVHKLLKHVREKIIEVLGHGPRRCVSDVRDGLRDDTGRGDAAMRTGAGHGLGGVPRPRPRQMHEHCRRHHGGLPQRLLHPVRPGHGLFPRVPQCAIFSPHTCPPSYPPLPPSETGVCSNSDKNFLGWTPETEEGTDATGYQTDALELRAKYERSKASG